MSERTSSQLKSSITPTGCARRESRKWRNAIIAYVGRHSLAKLRINLCRTGRPKRSPLPPLFWSTSIDPEMNCRILCRFFCPGTSRRGQHEDGEQEGKQEGKDDQLFRLHPVSSGPLVLEIASSPNQVKLCVAECSRRSEDERPHWPALQRIDTSFSTICRSVRGRKQGCGSCEKPNGRRGTRTPDPLGVNEML
jgi:hypothetical protein